MALKAEIDDLKTQGSVTDEPPCHDTHEHEDCEVEDETDVEYPCIPGRLDYFDGKTRYRTIISLDGLLAELDESQISYSLSPTEISSALINFPFSPIRSTGITHLLEALPDRQVTDILVESYIKSFDTFCPVLNTSAFVHTYDSFWRDMKAVEVTWLPTLFSVLAIALRVTPDLVLYPAVNINEYADKLIMAAEESLLIGKFVTEYTFETVQALVLVQQYYDMFREYGSTIGFTVQIAKALGLHQDPEILQLDVASCKVRRQVWLCVYNLDQFASLRSGLPSVSQQDEVNEYHQDLTSHKRFNFIRHVYSFYKLERPTSYQQLCSLDAAIQASQTTWTAIDESQGCYLEMMAARHSISLHQPYAQKSEAKYHKSKLQVIEVSRKTLETYFAYLRRGRPMNPIISKFIIETACIAALLIANHLRQKNSKNAEDWSCVDMFSMSSEHIKYVLPQRTRLVLTYLRGRLDDSNDEDEGHFEFPSTEGPLIATETPFIWFTGMNNAACTQHGISASDAQACFGYPDSALSNQGLFGGEFGLGM
ncbi:putative transcriptional regulatory protein [Neolecta irregularis DAH-3]|uniref:Putative transcriptional regulatory protein n=1 Tax=Neolecta irregularis (strain DAH-3) TaxID=1198029 RepID=A0A1U7LR99_NEOID|nr:putative transcriptional regulatory protein [Neolecta irregularis DAH-3]|eukprot:OLL25196.1 putative transcriptional regulatory protein [Neolecta irregularis DAH-3]